jgi:hypothetical protein
VREYLAHYDPDVVVVLSDDSDLYDNVVYEELADAEGRFSSSDVEAMFARRDEVLEAIRRRTSADDQGARVAALWASVIGYLRQIRDELAALGVPMTVVVYPYPHFTADYVESHVAPAIATLQAEGFDVLDLYPALMPRRHTHYFSENRHWNARGSALVAGRLADHLGRAHPDLAR